MARVKAVSQGLNQHDKRSDYGKSQHDDNATSVREKLIRHHKG